MSKKTKCEHLAPYMVACEAHKDDPYDCPDRLFCRAVKGRYGIPIRDGGLSFVAIKYCPFCGEKLKRWKA